MAIRRILLETCVGESRAVALDKAGRPVGLWLDRWSDQARDRLRVGDVREARLRTLDPKLKGAFADLGPDKGAAFIRLPEGHRLTEGQMVRFRVEAETTRQKLPRGVLAKNAILHRAGFEDWCTRLPGGKLAPIENVPPGTDEIQHAFDDALSPRAQIPGGGTMTIERTTALTAVDIDTSGRGGQGTAASRALKINSDAAEELARQCILRGLGGLVVMDCVAPLNRESGRKVRETFLSAWQALSFRTAKAEPPSSFGLMELSLAWAETPLAECMLDQNGAPTPETVCLSGIRALQKALTHNTMDRLTLRLPTDAFAWMAASGLDLTGALTDIHASRFEIVGASLSQPEVA